MAVAKITDIWDKAPRLIKVFLMRAAALFIGWQLLYRLVLRPFRFPDWQLTNLTAEATARFLSLFYTDVNSLPVSEIGTHSAIIRIDKAKIIGIADPCNALDIYVLYVAFLLCFPGIWKRKTVFILLGLPYIFALNIIRCAVIAWLNINYRGWVEVTHHYLFTTALYLLVFFVWVLFTKKGLPDAR